MAVNRTPVLKRCRSLGLDPVYLGVDKKSKTVKEIRKKDFRVWSPVEREAEG